LILRSTSGLLDVGAAAVDAPKNDEALAAVDDAPKNDEALLCRLEMPIVGGADPKEKGLGEGAGAWGSSGMWAAFGFARSLAADALRRVERTDEPRIFSSN
jgi:hypothetical protein